MSGSLVWDPFLPVFWGMMAHFGVLGLLLYGWFLAVVARMMSQTLRWTRGTDHHAVIWGMVAAIIGYWIWSFVEFSFDEKPFWEFLALLTVCWGLAKPQADGLEEQQNT